MMVAYSFHRIFAPQVAALTKRQTIRADRRRHARPGEPVQLFTAMRTRQCQKLVDRDPTCSSVLPIAIEVTTLIDEFIASIEIDGRSLHRDEIEPFAAADGFAPIDFGWWQPPALVGQRLQAATARSNMGVFWLKTHGVGRFTGVLIKWDPAP